MLGRGGVGRVAGRSEATLWKWVGTEAGLAGAVELRRLGAVAEVRSRSKEPGGLGIP